jgi:hypothetical protein
MKNLLNIAVAECIYEWQYVSNPWMKYWVDYGGSFQSELVDYLETRNTWELLTDVRDIYKYRAIIEMPIRKGGKYCVKLRKIDGSSEVCHFGTTMEEAAVRACLLVVGVEVG